MFVSMVWNKYLKSALWLCILPKKSLYSSVLHVCLHAHNCWRAAVVSQLRRRFASCLPRLCCSSWRSRIGYSWKVTYIPRLVQKNAVGEAVSALQSSAATCFVFLSHGVWTHEMFTTAPVQESTWSEMPRDGGRRCVLPNLTQVGDVRRPAGLMPQPHTRLSVRAEIFQGV